MIEVVLFEGGRTREGAAICGCDKSYRNHEYVNYFPFAVSFTVRKHSKL